VTAQAKGLPPILEGKSTLLLTPTGSGKTLAAFLAVIDRLMFSAEPPKKERLGVLYVSPPQRRSRWTSSATSARLYRAVRLVCFAPTS
jgi:ATP-dependent helicase YprA (DUF1998 family)